MKLTCNYGTIVECQSSRGEVDEGMLHSARYDLMFTYSMLSIVQRGFDRGNDIDSLKSIYCATKELDRTLCEFGRVYT